MPRTARAAEAGLIYHVLNRGNGRMRLFHKPADYLAFERVLEAGLARYPVELLTYCIMPNHWHLVVRPGTNDALGRWLGWVGVTHVRRHHEHYHSRGGGHLYQGRFKSFPVSSDEHFLTLCRYVEANPHRAKLVARAEEWRWCGLWHRRQQVTTIGLADWPVARPADWLRRVHRNLRADALAQLRECVARGRPLGDPAWVQATAKRLHLDFTLRGPGRPKKNQ
jgi:putative transposase